MAPPPRCLYEVLGVARAATDDEIKKAYRREALVHHPDKNPHNLDAAEEAFKQVQHAYTVLSDPHERAWYDDHRADILRGREPGSGGAFANGESRGPSAATDVDLFSLFSASAFSAFDDSPTGFFAVFSDVFSRLWAEERAVDGASRRRPPQFGAPDADWPAVRDFYREWDAFSSAKTFAFADKWRLGEAPNRDYRRAMERDNKKERARVRKEFNASIRELVAFVKKRDPRVAKRKEKEARDKEQAERDATERRKQLARERKDDLERARAARDEALEEDAEELDQILANIALDEKLERRQRRRRRRKTEPAAEDVDGANSDDESAGSGAATAFVADDVDDDDDDDDDVDGGDDDGIEVGNETVGEEVGSDDAADDSDEEEEEYIDEEELYCAACRKMFRTVPQRVDHERSKKHKQALAKLQREVLKEERELGTEQVGNGATERSAEHSSEDTALEDAERERAATAEATPCRKRKKKNRGKQFGTTILAQDSQRRDDAPLDEANGHDGVANGEADMAADDGDAEGTSGAAEDEEKEKVLSKREKRKLREKRKKDNPERGDSSCVAHKCNRCGAGFPSRSKLMRHVKEKGHAIHVE